jgi:hypothetical protein
MHAIGRNTKTGSHAHNSGVTVPMKTGSVERSLQTNVAAKHAVVKTK